MTNTVTKDVIIIGGGIAGLWLLNRLVDAGFDAVLLTDRALGSGQTIASQGMIHGGIKYALSGTLTSASNTMASMPDYWSNCLAGAGDVSLADTRLLSRTCYLWPRNSFRSRLNAFLGSKALRGRVAPLPEARFPDFFKNRITGPLYQLSDIVLDVPSLLASLSSRVQHRIHQTEQRKFMIDRQTGGAINSVSAATGTSALTIKAQRYIFTAGEGNQSLLAQFGLEQTPMQVRPLQMVMVQHQFPDPIFVHCVADRLSSTPELTITTHPYHKSGWVWYLGGELAERGANLSEAEQITAARDKLTGLFPWCDFSGCRWSACHINRAEPAQASGGRPDNAFLNPAHNFMVGWPTKLTLAPALANMVLQELDKQAI
ncbi:MAG: FAD-dependent oxidoreductase, partial [Pseudohongiellaceae bacterium]